MENVDKTETYSDFEDLISGGFHWDKTKGKEGVKFWIAVSKSITASYSDLKHLDLS